MCEQTIAGYIVLAVLIGWVYKIFTDISKGEEDIQIYRTREDMFADNPMTKEEIEFEERNKDV